MGKRNTLLDDNAAPSPRISTDPPSECHAYGVSDMGVAKVTYTGALCSNHTPPSYTLPTNTVRPK